MAGVRSSRHPAAPQSGEPDQAVPDSPVAQRLRRPRWTDARLLVGGALVLAATLAGATLPVSYTHLTLPTILLV